MTTIKALSVTLIICLTWASISLGTAYMDMKAQIAKAEAQGAHVRALADVTLALVEQMEK
jgi:hypothetical protein